jgi:asparagine synthase (glutamine-hydrolysing)
LSAFAVLFDQTNTPVDAGVLERVMERLKHRGPDGRDVHLGDCVAMGHWHFWTTPEDVGERQPLSLKGLPFRMVLDGRLDNRAELLKRLDLDPADDQRYSDAAIVLHAYARWGEGCFKQFIGEFALVIHDEQRNRLICARDPLGDRTMFFATFGTCLVIASEPWAVAGANGSSVELNENAVAHYFALKATEDGQTLFKGIDELLPAHVMAFDPSGFRQWRYWQPDPAIRLRGKSDEEYAEQFRTLLEESVRCRMRSASPVGVLMSGGLDSTSVACLAACMLSPSQLTTFSYVFNELKECDEREYIEAVQSRCGIRSIQIPCDDAWPYKDWQNWPGDPNRPEGNPYRLMKERTYQCAHQEGVRVLLTGGFGDHLYSGAEDWLADLIEDRGLSIAWKELAHYLQIHGLQRVMRAVFLRRVVRRIFDALPGGRKLHRTIRPYPWLTDYVNDSGKLHQESNTRLGNRSNLVGLRIALDSHGEIFYGSRYALELRHPFRDRRLVEYVLSLPAYQLFRGGLYKHILRVAMKNILPEIIRTRRRPTSLMTLFSLGVSHERQLVQPIIQDAQAMWRKFVRADWLLKHWDAVLSPEEDGPHALIPWLCLSYEKWYESFGSIG